METRTAKVLVIDDDQSVRQTICCILRSRTIEVIEAESGEKGIDLAHTANPALILSDICMPNMDGFAVLDFLQRDPRTINIPFIFMTGWADSAEVSNQLKPDVRLIWKPFDVQMLLYSVLAHLGDSP
jgi:CheY-like chemotaxis protein